MYEGDDERPVQYDEGDKNEVTAQVNERFTALRRTPNRQVES